MTLLKKEFFMTLLKYVFFPSVSRWKSILIPGYYNRVINRFCKRILDQRDETQTARAWAQTGLPSCLAEVACRSLVEVCPWNCPATKVLPDDELRVWLGHWIKRLADDLETERFFTNCEKAAGKKLPMDVNERGELAWYSEDMTVADFLRLLDSCERRTESTKPFSKGCYGFLAIQVVLLGVVCLTVGWINAQTDGILYGIGYGALAAVYLLAFEFLIALVVWLAAELLKAIWQ